MLLEQVQLMKIERLHLPLIYFRERCELLAMQVQCHLMAAPHFLDHCVIVGQHLHDGSAVTILARRTPTVFVAVCCDSSFEDAAVALPGLAAAQTWIARYAASQHPGEKSEIPGLRLVVWLHYQPFLCRRYHAEVDHVGRLAALHLCEAQPSEAS